MFVVDSKEMKTIDDMTISKGLQENVLMEQASFSVKEIVSDLNPKKTLIIAGTGNNGGDALATGRLLKNDGFEVEIYIYGNVEKSSYGFKNQMLLCKKYNINFINDISTIEKYDIIIEGIIGNGLNGEIRGELLNIIEIINSSKGTIVSIDIPTGISSDNGQIMGKAINADLTVTFGYLKIGHLIYPGREYSGEIKLTKLSFDRDFEKNLKRKLITKEMVEKILPKRSVNSHKYDYGVVTILSGSKKFPGSSILAALGAQKTGVGIVNLVTPSYTPILDYEPSIIYENLNKDYFEIDDFESIKQKLEKSDSILIGPGIGRKSDGFIKKVLNNYPNKKIIVDADAIQNIKNINSCENILITPHVGEFNRLTNIDELDVKFIENYAKSKNINVLFKSSTSFITDGYNSFFNVFGDDSLSKGGTGDLLSGVISSFLAQGSSLTDSAIIGSYLVYKTSFELGSEKTKYTVTPIDIIHNIYKELNNLRGD
ncbi:MAG: NAD(P)H-hydrate dehydratase [Thermotogota bacterium]